MSDVSVQRIAAIVADAIERERIEIVTADMHRKALEEVITDGLKQALRDEKAEPDRSKPPCLDCGAKTDKEAGNACICNGDRDWCHGQELWPEDEKAEGDVGEQVVSDNDAHEIIIGEILKRNPVDVTADAIWRQLKPATTQHPEAVGEQVFLCAKCGYGSQEHGMPDHPAYQCVAGMRLFTAPPPDPEALRLLEDVYDNTYGDRCTGGDIDTYCRICEQSETGKHADWCPLPKIEAYIANQQEKGRD